MVEKAIMTVKEASSYINCGVSSVRKMISTKELKHFRVGVKILINKADIDSWMQSKMVGGENTNGIKWKNKENETEKNEVVG